MELEFSDLDTYLLAQKGKIIHQVWFGTIPNKKSAKKTYKKLKHCRDSWRVKNPDWCCMEWSKENCQFLVSKIFPEHLDLLKGYRYEIQRCDTVRYLILLRYGGFYADMDMLDVRSVNEILQDYKNDIYFIQSPNSFLQGKDYISNSFMYSKTSNHPFWRKILLELEKVKIPTYYTKHLAVMFSTGPGILNRLYSKYKYEFKLKSLPWKLFHPLGINDIKITTFPDKNIYTVHLGNGSWENLDSKILLFFAKEWKILVFILCIFIVYFLLVFVVIRGK